MVDVCCKRCAFEGCEGRPSFGIEGKFTKLCRRHGEEGMMSVDSKRRAHEGCIREPTFGVEGSKMALHCRQHARDGMVGVRSKHCAHEGGIRDEGTKMPVFCSDHTRDGMETVLTKAVLMWAALPLRVSAWRVVRWQCTAGRTPGTAW